MLLCTEEWVGRGERKHVVFRGGAKAPEQKCEDANARGGILLSLLLLRNFALSSSHLRFRPLMCMCGSSLTFKNNFSYKNGVCKLTKTKTWDNISFD